MFCSACIKLCVRNQDRAVRGEFLELVQTFILVIFSLYWVSCTGIKITKNIKILYKYKIKFFTDLKRDALLSMGDCTQLSKNQ